MTPLAHPRTVLTPRPKLGCLSGHATTTSGPGRFITSMSEFAARFEYSKENEERRSPSETLRHLAHCLVPMSIMILSTFVYIDVNSLVISHTLNGLAQRPIYTFFIMIIIIIIESLFRNKEGEAITSSPISYDISFF